MREELSIIVVTFNRKKELIKCLHSISTQRSIKDISVWVVNNNACEYIPKHISREIGDVKIIKNNCNQGLSKALNKILPLIDSEYVLIMNDDVILNSNFIYNFNNFRSLLPHYIGGVMPKILKLDVNSIDSCGLCLSWLRRFYNLYENKIHIPDKKKLIFGVSLACCILKKEMLEDIKVNGEYFDEEFFLLLEDFDLSWRARKHGWKFLYVPQLVCYHKGGISKSKSKFVQYLSFRNRYYLLLKNEDNFFTFMNAFLIYDLPRWIYLFLTNRCLFIKALKEVYNNLPLMLDKRKKIRNNIKYKKYEKNKEFFPY